MRRIVVLVLAPIALTAACLFPDLSPLTDAGQTGDACTSCGDSGQDAAHDASPDGADGAAASYCASLTPAPKFCEDFDTGGFAAQFTNSHTSVDGLLGSDGTAFVSPPSSLFAKVGTKTSTGEQAYLTRAFTFTGAAKQLSYAFDLRIDAWGTGESGVLASIVLDDGAPSRHSLSLYVRNGKVAVEELFTPLDGGGGTIDHNLAWGPKLGTWARVAFSVDLGAKTCAATVDGKADLTASALDPSWTLGTPSVELGFTYIASNTSIWTARFDDVVVDWK